MITSISLTAQATVAMSMAGSFFLVGCGGVHHASIAAGAGSTASPAAEASGSCGITPAHLSLARASARVGDAIVGTPPNSVTLDNLVFGNDSRDFRLQSTYGALRADNIGLNNPNVLPTTPVDLIVSYGNFDLNAVGESVVAGPGGPTASPPSKIANVRYAVVNAMTGDYIGQEIKLPGCTD